MPPPSGATDARDAESSALILDAYRSKPLTSALNRMKKTHIDACILFAYGKFRAKKFAISPALCNGAAILLLLSGESFRSLRTRRKFSERIEMRSFLERLIFVEGVSQKVIGALHFLIGSANFVAHSNVREWLGRRELEDRGLTNAVDVFIVASYLTRGGQGNIFTLAGLKEALAN